MSNNKFNARHGLSVGSTPVDIIDDTGAILVNSASATKLATARTISLSGDVVGSVSFDGTGNADITTTIQPNSVALGTDTTGNYVAGMSGGTHVTIGGTAGEGWSPSVSVDATDLNTASTIVARDASGNFSAGTISAALSGNASTASTLQTARTISLSGDVVGSVSFNGGSSVDISTTIQPNSVALGTDTTGNYMSNVTGGTGVSVSHTQGEGSTATVSIGQAVGTTDNVTFNSVTVNGTLTSDDITSTNISIAGNATITGNLTVSGTTTTVNSTTIALADANLELARNATTAAQANGAGITVTGPTTAATLTYTSADDRWNLNKDLNVGRIYGNVTGAVTGNASTASAWQTARTLSYTGDATGSMSVDGSGNASAALTLANSGVTAGSYGSSTSVPVITVDAKGRVTGVSTSSISGSLTFTGDVTGTGSTGSSTALTLSASGVTAGTYNNVTVDAKGRVTSGSNTSYLTSYTESDTLASVTGRGATSSTQITLSGAGDNSSTYSSLRFSGYNQGGGVGYHGFFEVNNTYASATNPKKFFRLDSAGTIQIINSAYTGNIFNLTDAGALTVPSTFSASNISGTNTGDETTATIKSKLGISTLSGSNTGDQTITLTGDVTGSGTGSFATTLANSGVTAGTYTKITVDAKGRATSGTTLSSGDIPSLSSIYLPLSGGTMTGPWKYTSSQPIQLGPNTGSPIWAPQMYFGGDVGSTQKGWRIGAYYSSGTDFVFSYSTADQSYGSDLTALTYTEKFRFYNNGAFNTTGAITQSGNQVLHAGNYTSYSPSLTGSGASGTWAISISGWAAALQTSRNFSFAPFGTYGGASSFNGSADVALAGVTAHASETTTFSTGISGYGNSIGMVYASDGPINGWHRYIQMSYSDNTTNVWQTQIAQWGTSGLGFRAREGGTLGTTGWSSWYTLLHSSNYTSYSPSLTGSGASGTWPISITGDANTLDGNHASAFYLASNPSGYITSSGSISGSSGSAGSLTGGDSNFYGILYNANSGDLNTYNSPGLYSSEYTGSTNKPSGVGVGHWIQISDAGGTDVKTQWYNTYQGSPWMRLMWGNTNWGAWQNLLTSSNYSSYALPLSGGTLSGYLQAGNASTYDNPGGWAANLVASGVNHARVRLKATSYNGSGDRETFMWLDNSVNPATGIYSTAGVFNFMGSINTVQVAGNAVLHAGNYNSYALPLSGGTMSGNIDFGQATNPALRSNYAFQFLTLSNGALNAKFGGIQVSDSYSGSIPTNGILFGTDTTLVRNSNSYGSIFIDGARNGYFGTMYNTANGVAGWMTSGNTSGFYNHSYGWKYYHESGAFYVSDATYGGGTMRTTLHAGNYWNYALPLSGGQLTGDLQLLGNYLRFDQSGTRSWNIRATGGNLDINSGDGSGLLRYNGYTLFNSGNYKASSAFHQRVHYGTTAGNSGYYKIRILPATSWMLSFIIRIYQGYQSFDIRVSGYNYGGNYWYSPEASLMDSTAGSVDVRFGYDSAYNLWVAVPASSYTGLDIVSVTNGYAQIDGNYADQFSIEYQTSLTGTVQTTTTAYRPVKYNEGLTTSNYGSYALPLSGGTMVGTLTMNNGANSNVIQFGDSTKSIYTSSYWLILKAHANEGVKFRNNSDVDTFYINHGASNYDAWFRGNVTAYSDERVKTNWLSMPTNFVEGLADVKAGTFDRLDCNARQAGVSAQSIQNLMPEVVMEGADGMLSVAYGNAALVSAIELAKRVVKQNEEIDDLRHRITKLETIISHLLGE